MTRRGDISSINCTSCGAGLDILGGGRVQTHVCGYCGSQLDAQDNYKVLQQFKDLERPDSPFKIGMTGTIKGVEYTIIGTLGFEEYYRGRTWRWVDHQLFSPTHGYAFLTVEKGHFIFSRAYRKATSPRWIGAQTVEYADTPPSVSSDLVRYRYYDSSNPTITFAEGEFNWQPKIGDKSSVVSLMSNDAVLAFSRTETEEEIIRSVYPNQLEIAESFGITSAPALQGIHRLQPYVAFVHKPFMRKTTLYAMVACVVAYFAVLLGGGGSQIEYQRFSASDLPATVPFEIATANRVARINLQSSQNNSWAFFEVDVIGPDEETLFETGRTISYYTGRDSEGTWTEGSQSATLRFRPKVAGPHKLAIRLGEDGGAPGNNNVTVRIREGVLVARWFLFAAMFFGLLWFITSLGAARHAKARWKGWDWND